ncbi:MAG TPA: thioesterase domain-containing protein, partial [Candidatus Binatia bacterium]|nr:thioesterase domain-containing protein [Candidatus Binatia bacterium]
WSSVLKIESGEGPVPVGAPFANTQFYVLDANGELVPRGAPGELYIGGDGVGRGYLGQPELTAERFLPDRFRDRPGARIYRTGDLVRLKQDGQLEFLGRGDSQVKLRGFRIELGEIESVLLQRRDIAEAVAIVGKDAAGESALWAYLAPRQRPTDGGAAVTAGARAALSRAVPRYMMPSAFVVLDALPRLPNGKIDRRALPAPAAAPAVAQDGMASELTPTEARLAQIWSAVLGVQGIGADDNFFELGGHSLLAARMLARIKTELNRRITLAALFRAPTLAELARLIEHDSAREFDFRQVVKLQPNGSRPPIIAINNTGIYYSLSKRLGPEQPFTSLQLFDPTRPAQALPQTFGEIATAYVQLIRRVQPQGPYALLGWCIAGALAFEIACQLREQGQEVSQLVLIDTYVPNYLQRLPRWRAFVTDLSYRWALIGQDWRKYRSGLQGFGEFLSHRTFVQRFLKLIGREAPKPLVPDPAVPVRDLPAENYDQWLLNYLVAAADRYVPRRYAGRITLIRSAEEPCGRFLDLRMGWGEFAEGGVDVRVIDGDHFSIFRNPGVQQMAQCIAGALDAPAGSSRAPGVRSAPHPA